MALYLNRDILDKEIVGAQGFKGGKVDDLLIDIREGKPPTISAIVTGPGSLSRQLGSPIEHLTAWLRVHLMGIRDAHEIVIPWEHVLSIDVVVHLDVPRRPAGLLESEDAVWRNWLRRIPGG